MHTHTKPWNHGRLEVAENGRFLQHTDGTPFFWLADTCWLMLTRLNLAEVEHYFADRAAKGFNVAQVVVVWDLVSVNQQGRLPFLDGDITRPDTGAGPGGEASYWDNLEAVFEVAARHGLYLGLVPMWGRNLKSGAIPAQDLAWYGNWLARRYRHHPNLVWLNGGDIHGSTQMHLWQALGSALRAADREHLITFHPFGRSQSGTWFHNEPWLDFNMIQSGHRDYHQIGFDDPATWKGPDNWRYLEQDYARYPAKPVIDGEPCYEDIPRGLHDPAHGFWDAHDARRYAYWAVFAGAAGHTYGQNAVIMTYKEGYEFHYGNDRTWDVGLQAPGSAVLQHLKSLMLAFPYFERIPDQTVIVGDPGWREDHLLVTRGSKYLLAYRFTPKPYTLDTSILGERLTQRWFDPLTGTYSAPQEIAAGITEFTPPGPADSVLVLEAK